MNGFLSWKRHEWGSRGRGYVTYGYPIDRSSDGSSPGLRGYSVTNPRPTRRLIIVGIKVELEFSEIVTTPEIKNSGKFSFL